MQFRYVRDVVVLSTAVRQHPLLVLPDAQSHRAKNRVDAGSTERFVKYARNFRGFAIIMVA